MPCLTPPPHKGPFHQIWETKIYMPSIGRIVEFTYLLVYV